MDDKFSNRYAGLYFDPKDPGNLKIFQARQLFLRAAAGSVPGFAVSLFEKGGTVVASWVKNNGALPLNLVRLSIGYTGSLEQRWEQLSGALTTLGAM